MNSSSDKCRLCFIIRILSFYRSGFLKINVFKFVLFKIFRQPMAPQMETIFLKTGRELCHSLRCHYQRSGDEKIMALLIHKSSMFSGGHWYSGLKTACCFAEDQEWRLFWWPIRGGLRSVSDAEPPRMGHQNSRHSWSEGPDTNATWEQTWFMGCKY